MKLNGINIEGGWTYGRESRGLHLRITDPASRSTFIEIELDETQVLNMLSGLHDGYVGGSFTLYEKQHANIGKQHVMVDVTVPREVSGEALNIHFQAACQAAGGHPWQPIVIDRPNSHRWTGKDEYTETMHAYFDWDKGLDDIGGFMVERPGVKFSSLRTMKDFK